MNVFKTLRKPYLATFLASIILFISCEQNSLDSVENAFNYSVHKELIETTSAVDINNMLNINSSSAKSNSINRNLDVIDNINNYYNSDLSLPNELLGMTDYNPQEVVTTALNNGWMNQYDLNLMDQFESDFQSLGFDGALENYENTVLSLELNDAEFSKKNLVANALKSMNNYYPEIFSSSSEFSKYSRGWGCFRAAAALILSSVGLASCVTVVACGLAVSAWILSYSAYVDNCQN
ncbi:MAG: hypothetical protein ACPHZC_03545 [Flavobacteriaceae bacterium]